MLACARIGAPHSVVFGGFSATALQSRIDDAQRQAGHHLRRRLPARQPVGAQAGRRRGARAVAGQDGRARAGRTPHRAGRRVDRRPRRLVARRRRRRQHRARGAGRTTASTRSSSSTRPARPGSRRASCTPPAATSPRCAYTHRNVFDLKPETDVYWCTADIGWVTGHSYIVYGPLANGATQVMYEGTPDTPHKGRFWEIVAKYGVTILYTAPTAIRTFMKWGEEIPAEARPVVAAAARLGRRADQPGGLDLVPPGHRRRPHARSSTPGGRPRPAPS